MRLGSELPDCFACSAPLKEETIIKLQMLLINKLLTNAQWPFQTPSTKQQDDNERGIELSTRRRRNGVRARRRRLEWKLSRVVISALIWFPSAQRNDKRAASGAQFMQYYKPLCLLARCQSLLNLRSGAHWLGRHAFSGEMVQNTLVRDPTNWHSFINRGTRLQTLIFWHILIRLRVLLSV